ncbi:TPA: acyltransferase family protein [Klebsiella quasipneumoniae subsp. quasipneumoniae]|nr:acyltransferase family protein [Klebsiella quasipneumoniae subsp. quasipneumoniae]
MNANSDWVNTTKGIGILLVVLGHIYGGVVSGFIFIFHMPLFFFLSGMLLREKEPLPYIKRKAKKFLGYYLFYMILLLLINIMAKLAKHDITVEYTLDVLMDCFLGGRHLTGWFGVFWFLGVLFVSQQLTNYILFKTKPYIAFIFFTVMLAFAYSNYLFFNIKLPFCVDVVLYAAPIMYIGSTFRNIKIPTSMVLLLLIGISISFSLFIPFQSLFTFDMKQGSYGIPAYSLIVSVLISYVIIILSKLINTKILHFIGESSMAIMFIHQFFHLAIAEHATNNRFIVYFITLSLSIMYCIAVKALKNKYKVKLMKYAY